MLLHTVGDRIYSLLEAYRLFVEADAEQIGRVAELVRIIGALQSLDDSTPRLLKLPWVQCSLTKTWLRNSSVSSWVGSLSKHLRAPRIGIEKASVCLPYYFGQLQGTGTVELMLRAQHACIVVRKKNKPLRKIFTDHASPKPNQQRRLKGILEMLGREAELLLAINDETDARDDLYVHSTASLFCLKNLYQAPGAFQQWYFTPSNQFSGISPNRWFVEAFSFNAAAVFQDFCPSLCREKNSWSLQLTDMPTANPTTPAK